jgi:16S rRNA (adenine1518-N6/adenine1519-N6)-dimethyltransferase
VRAPWGQNFLASPAVAKRIVAALGRSHPDPEPGRVLEIGPGRGALTAPLLEQGVHVTAVELDANLVAGLNARWGAEPRLSVANADFLDWSFPPVEGSPYRVIGNLPYSAAAAIIQKVLAWTGWDRAVFMVQKEVALRITAQPGGKNWGLLALSVQSRANARRLFDVLPGAFRPAPKVTSTVFELDRLAKPRVECLDQFFKVAHAAFGQRRKTIVNSLSHGLGLDRETVASVLRALNLDPTRRPETFTLDDFERISKMLLNSQLANE